MTKGSSWRAAPIAIIAAGLWLVFAYTVALRRPDAGVLSYGHHEWLTAHTLKFARIWWHEGAFNLDFLMMETPRDIEHPTLASRQIYPSYPPGAVLAAYAAAKTLGVEPSVALVMAFNRALHLFIALCLSLAVWLWLPRQHWALRLLGGTMPGVCYLLLPGPMFWQQNVYFTDTAVMGPWALLLLAISMERVVRRPWSEALIAFAFVWGFATDWFFVSIALVLISVRVAVLLAGGRNLGGDVSWPRRLSREVAGPALAGCLVFGFYGWQLTKHALWDTWRAKLALRTFSTGDGADSMRSNFNEVVWGYAREQYGSWGRALLFVAFVFAAIYVVQSLRLHRLRTTDADDLWSLPRTSFVAVAALAPLLHTYLLKNHTYLHDFSALKHAVPLCCIPFAVLPRTLTELFSGRRFPKSAVIVAAACLGLIYALLMHSRYRGMVPPRNPEIALMGDFVSRSTGYDDVVFSRLVKAEPYPSEPHLLSHSLKLIHQVDRIEQLAQWVDGLPAGANVVWFGDTGRDGEPVGGQALWAAGQRVSEGSMFLLRLSRERFRARLQESGEAAHPEQ
ncbi:MAG: hypothetical protein Q8L48_27835 [Archangium sp.]|nr:hypothetical protein [Archangium sp.]